MLNTLSEKFLHDAMHGATPHGLECRAFSAHEKSCIEEFLDTVLNTVSCCSQAGGFCQG